MNRRPVVSAIVVLAVLAAGAFTLVYFWGFNAYYYPDAPAPHFARPRDLAEAQRDDLDYLRKFLHRDWSYTPTTRAKAAAVIDRTLSGPLPLSRGAFELAVSRVVAIADNGHTNVWGADRANRLNRLPVRFYLFADGLFVVRALPEAHGVLGRKIVAFNGHPFAAVRTKMNFYAGGAEEERDSRLPFALEAPELLHAAGMANADDAVTLTAENPDGSRFDMRLAALLPNPRAPKNWPWQDMQPGALLERGKAWQAGLRGPPERMLLFAEPARQFVMRNLPAQHAWYLRFDSNRGTKAEPIAAFTKKAEAALLASKPARVIIDMRFNGGGDYTTTADFMRDLPLELPDATFYVLEGSNTFSAGMTSVAFLKQAGGARTILVGSRPGDRIRFHAEGSDYCLPFSKICTSARTAIHDYSTTLCHPLRECFALNWFYPVAIRSFEPQIHAPLSWKALSEAHDPALAAIFPDQGF